MIHSFLAEFKDRKLEQRFLDYELPHNQVHSMLAYVVIIFCNLFVLFQEFLSSELSINFITQLCLNSVLFLIILLSCRNFLSIRDVSSMHRLHLIIWILFVLIQYGPWISSAESIAINIQFLPLLVFAIYFLLPLPFSYSQILIFGVLLAATYAQDRSILNESGHHVEIFTSLAISVFISTLIRYPIEFNKRHVFYKWKEEEKQVNDKEELFAIMAHDLRAPINAQAQILRLANMFWNIKSPEEIHSLILKVGGSTEHMARLVDNMLSWSRIQQGQISLYNEDLEISSAVKEAIEILQLSIKQKNIEINLPHSDRKATVHGDSNLLRTILINLLNNAIKYSHDNSTIEINYLQNSDHSTLAIKDHGQGMEESQITKILEGSNKISNKGTHGEIGTGLGMKVSLNFIEKLGGNLEIKSAPNKGALFAIKFPIKK
jgi:signal transduction histidine kinase